MKELRLRPRAEEDLIERTGHYGGAGGSAVGERFFDASVRALDAVGEMPGIGSPRVGERADVPGLRRVPVEGFPCGWFYIERDDFIDVIRLLADRQDLAALFDDE